MQHYMITADVWMCWTGNQTSLAFCVAAILPVTSQWIIKIFLKAHLKSPRYHDIVLFQHKGVLKVLNVPSKHLSKKIKFP